MLDFAPFLSIIRCFSAALAANEAASSDAAANLPTRYSRASGSQLAALALKSCFRLHWATRKLTARKKKATAAPWPLPNYS
jgi:hypothetical protein